MVENVKLRQIIAKIDFLRMFQQKTKFWENLRSGCHGNTFVRVTSKFTNVAKITLLDSMETWSNDKSDKIPRTRKRNLSATFYKKQF